MKWIKKGRICGQDTFSLDWYRKNTMVPVPYLINDTCLRIFITMCDADNVGRIGYVDVNPENPSEIIGHSKTPALNIGADGTFDDSGVLPSAFFEKDGKLYLFYSAYQKQVKVPYSILTGLAVANEDLSGFTRLGTAPILERTTDEMFIRSAVFCLADNRNSKPHYKIYYSSGSQWLHNSVKQVPRYDIKCLESEDFFNWQQATPLPCIGLAKDEYGLTTPNVFKTETGYQMTYAIRSISEGYRLGYAESPDGLKWTRMDDRMGIDVSTSGWDSEMICFGNIFKHKDKTYLFYCGNHYGMAGMGYAELAQN